MRPTCNRLRDSVRRAVRCFRPAVGSEASEDATVGSAGARAIEKAAGWVQRGQKSRISEI